MKKAVDIFKAIIRVYELIEQDLAATEDEEYAAGLRLLRSELDGVMDEMEHVGLLEARA